MHADVSRWTFRPDRHYSAVVAQQGRVQLDAEANEQAAITTYLGRRLTADLLGPHAGPAAAAGFAISYQGDADPADLRIGGGRYYVDGILVDAARPAPYPPVPSGRGRPETPTTPETWTYWDQPDAYLDREREADELPRAPFLVYLRVAERLVTAVEDPALRETALGAALPDTAARLRVTWQVLPIREGFTAPSQPNAGNLREAFATWAQARTTPSGRLAVRAQQPSGTDEDPCVTRPDARYRGPENQLYRVEVHTGGRAGDATFKWSRDNGSVVAPVASIDGEWVTLAAPGRDDKLALHVGDWVEVVDDAYAARGVPRPLLRVVEVETTDRRVRLSDEPAGGVGGVAARHPFLRRWDHQAPGPRTDEATASGGAGSGGGRGDGALRIVEGDWVDLEDGVQVWFGAGGTYRTGDYWLVPARTLTGDVEWLEDAQGRPLLAPPHGPRVSYAPLAWVAANGTVTDLRLTFPTLTPR